MTDPYLGILLMLFITVITLVVMLLMASYLGPRNRTKTKQLPFECGSVSVGDVNTSRFSVRFYLIAMLFILFDIEVIFLYPWAVVLTDIGWTGFTAMLSFMLVLGVGLVYVWKKGALDWND